VNRAREAEQGSKRHVPGVLQELDCVGTHRRMISAGHASSNTLYPVGVDSTIYFGKIYIIEWLTPDDAKTGWELYQELQPIGIMSRPQVDVSFKRVRTRNEFIDYLRGVGNDFRETKKLPLIHIETHGLDVDGHSAEICSVSDDAVLWPELMQELIPLNQLAGLRLLVLLASCDGMWGIQILQPVERAAFLALLGPKETIGAGALEHACTACYRATRATGVCRKRHSVQRCASRQEWKVTANSTGANRPRGARPAHGYGTASAEEVS
jgi:hypothetical protein